MTASQGSEVKAGHLSEEYDAKDVTYELTATAESFVRKPNGKWAVDVRLDLVAILPDGRALRQNRLISIGGIIQEGRRNSRRS